MVRNATQAEIMNAAAHDAVQNMCDLFKETDVIVKLVDSCWPEHSVEYMADDITIAAVKKAKEFGYVDEEFSSSPELKQPGFWDFYAKVFHGAITKELKAEIEKRKRD
ncbi:MAG: hypothetical protein FVQ79_14275 [Planctomycetes bacterium]|nr:hypothetical protein [Planctomycetota bacterium]